ncbi:unnamed protein product [Fusarium venenatum]|uniref:Uncharacterized protein n=1 Tax=Fusarium venenatum TaxID=56646 RepID=A0A2L2TW43_9HYPO|nr:uncharacterized protein FVRRES_10194 [Fusarium venenatum]CEI70117.1 unnamed protein product [Fusarium venenatum]
MAYGTCSLEDLGSAISSSSLYLVELAGERTIQRQAEPCCRPHISEFASERREQVYHGDLVILSILIRGWMTSFIRVEYITVSVQHHASWQMMVQALFEIQVAAVFIQKATLLISYMCDLGQYERNAPVRRKEQESTESATASRFDE